MKDRAQLNVETTEALAHVQGYRGTGLYLALIALLDSVDEQQRETLVGAKPEDVPKVQGAISQVRALRRAMLATGLNNSPIG
jgi:hypothetical protein